MSLRPPRRSTRRTSSGGPSPYFTPAQVTSDQPVPRTRSVPRMKHEEDPSSSDPPTPVEKEFKRITRTVQARARATTGEPLHWRECLTDIEDYRRDHVAPVDTMGCERLGDTTGPEKDYRFQTLVSLMLSSQTKDQVNAAAIAQLKERLEGGLTAQAMATAQPELIHACINKVGFHNRKHVTLKQAAIICHEQYGGDIPDTLEGLLALNGVGPKMAYLTLQCAWKKNVGIGVDTHVHRIANRLGWVETKQPEETRLALEGWLPRELWRGINPTLVGYGQIVCKPIGPLCHEVCPVRRFCPSAQAPRSRVKREVKTEVKAEAKTEVEIDVKQNPDKTQNNVTVKTETDVYIKEERSEW